MSAAKLTPAGFRVDDRAAVYRLHNFCAASLSDGDDAATARRLLVLADMLRATAGSAFGRDFEAEGERVADQFWAHRDAAIRRARGEDA